MPTCFSKPHLEIDTSYLYVIRDLMEKLKIYMKCQGIHMSKLSDFLDSKQSPQDETNPEQTRISHTHLENTIIKVASLGKNIMDIRQSLLYIIDICHDHEDFKSFNNFLIVNSQKGIIEYLDKIAKEQVDLIKHLRDITMYIHDNI